MNDFSLDLPGLDNIETSDINLGNIDLPQIDLSQVKLEQNQKTAEFKRTLLQGKGAEKQQVLLQKLRGLSTSSQKAIIEADRIEQIKQTEAYQNRDIGDVSNIARGAGERAADLAGNVPGFAASAGTQLEEVAPLGGLVWEDGNLLPTYKDSDEWRAFNAEQKDGTNNILRAVQEELVDLDLDYTPRQTWEGVKDADGVWDTAKSVAGFALEQGLVSVPDMVAMVATLPTYLVSRTEEIAQERAKNDGRTEPSTEDLMIGATTSLVVTAMDRFGLDKVLKPFKAGSGKLGKVIKGTATETVTEGAQEFVEYAGGTVATEKGFDLDEALDVTAAGAVGGGGFGAIVAGTGAVVSTAKDVVIKGSEVASDKIGAALTRDIENLSDPKHKKYNPGKAATLVVKESIPEGSTIEDAKAFRDKVQELTNAEGALLDSKLKSGKIKLDDYEKQQEVNDAIDAEARSVTEEYTNSLAERESTEQDEKPTEEASQEETTEGASLDDTTADIPESTVPAKAAALTKELSKSKKELSEQDKAVLDVTFNSMRSGDDGVSIKVAKRITEDKLGNYTAEQKATAAQYISKSTEEVRKSVVEGTKNFIGINQYQRNISGSIASGNRQEAKRHLERFQKFGQKQQTKLRALLSAKAKYEAAGDGKKVTVDGFPKLYFNGNEKLINNIQAEFALSTEIYTQQRQEYIDTFSGSEATAPPVAEAIAETTTPPVAETEEVSAPIVSTTPEPTAEVKPKVGVTPEPKAKAKPVKKKKPATKVKIKKASKLSADPAVIEYFRHKLRGVYKQLSSKEKEAAKRIVAQVGAVTTETSRKELKAITNRVNDLVQRATVVKAPKAQPEVQSTLSDTLEPVLPPKVSETVPYTLASAILRTSYTLKGIKGFAQLFESTGQRTKSLLHTTENLFNTLTKDTLPDVSEKHRVFLQAAYKFNKKFSSVMTGTAGKEPLLAILDNILIKDGSKAFDTLKKVDPIYLITRVDEEGNRSIDPNIISTISMVAMNWVGTRAKDTLYNKDSDINAILGRDEEHEVTSHERSAFMFLGTSRRVVIETLGRDSLKALGIKAKQLDDIDGELQEQFITTLGNIAVAGLIETGYLGHTAKDAEFFAPFTTGETLIDNDESKRNFVAIFNKKSEPFEPDDSAQAIIDAMKDSDGGMTELFGLDSYTTGPVFTVSESIPKTMKGTFQKVPEKAREKIVRATRVKWQMKEKALQVFKALGPEWLMEMEGFNMDIESTVHVTDRDSAQGKNLSIQREVEHLTNFVTNLDGDLQKPFYFKYEFWKNMRVGLVSNTLNPQGSKIHRHFLNASNWNVNVNTDELRLQFKLAVVQAFGGSIDNDLTEVSVNRFDEIYKDSQTEGTELYNALQAIKKVQSGDTDLDTARADLLTAINTLGEKSHSFDGLMALAEYHPTNDFDTNLGVETDGKTNGVAIGLLQSALEYDTNNMAEATGVMLHESKTSYAEHISQPQNRDLYQQLAAYWQQALDVVTFGAEQGDVKGKVSVAVTRLPHIKELVGELMIGDEVQKLGRDLSKSPLMITNYGAAVRKVREALGYKILTSFRESIAKLDPNDPEQRGELETKLATMRAVLGDSATDSVFSMPAKGGEAKQKVLNMVMSKAQEAFVLKMIDKTYGKALSTAIEDQFKEFIEFRSVMNASLKISFNAFNIVYEKRLQEAVAKKNGVALNKKERLEIVESLRVLLPTFKNPLSEGSEDSIIAMKTDRGPNYSKEHQKVQTSFTRKLQGTDTKSITSRYSEDTYTDGGVSGVVLGIHSMDASMILDALDNFAVLGIHDATIASIADVNAVAKGYNKVFFETNRDFSLFESIQESTTKTLATLKKVSPESYAELNNMIAEHPDFIEDPYFKGNEYKGTEPIGTLERFTTASVDMGNRVAEAREELFERIKHVQQMPHHEAQHTPTSDADIGIQLEAELVRDKVKRMTDYILKSSEDVDINNFIPSRESDLVADNLQAEFDLLGKYGNVKETVEHTTHLKGILNDLVGKVIHKIDALEIKHRVGGDSTLGAIRGNTVFVQTAASTSPGNNTQMSAQEVLVHELTHAVTRFGLNDPANHLIRKELERLYEEARKVVSWKDFLTKDEDGQIVYQVNDVEEIKAAKATYDYIFRPTRRQDVTRIDPRTGKETQHTFDGHLDEFLAYALTNKQLLSALEKPTFRKKGDLVGASILETLQNVFQRIMDWIAGQLYDTNNVHMSDAVYNLAQQIAGIESDNKSQLLKGLNSASEQYAKVTAGLRDYVIEPISAFTKELETKPTVVGRATKIVRGLPKVAQAADLGKAVVSSMDRLGITEDNIFLTVIREMQGSKADNIRWHTLLRESKKFIDQGRKDIATNVTDQILKSFKTELSQNDRIAINRAMMKTDLGSLFANRTYEEVANLLRNPTALNTAIRAAEKELDVHGINASYYKNQADSLGHYMAQGKAIVDEGHMNAYSIAQLLGVVGLQVGETEIIPIGDLSKAEQVLEELATLRALHYTAELNKGILADVIDREYAAHNTDNGITMSLALHDGFKKDSLERLFNGNKTQTVKGYTTQIVNPGVAFKFGAADKDTVAAMAADGYILKNVLKRDEQHEDVSLTKGQAVHLYVSRNGGNATQMKFIASQTNTTMIGSDFIDFADNMEAANPLGQANIDRVLVKQAKEKMVKYQFQGFSVTNPKKEYVIPVRNESGNTVGYRYTMSEHQKRTLLEKNDDFANILGKMYGSVVDKTESKRINRKVVEMAYLDFKEGYVDNPSAFVELSANSTEKYKEIFALMPAAMQRDIKAVWGSKPMKVRRELIPLIFGYKKMSLANANIKLAGKEYRLKGKTKEYIQVAESIWQDVVKTAKDFIVIKSVIVPAANVASNMLLLKVNGVPAGDMLKQKALAMDALNSYSSDHSEREQVARRLKTDKKISDTTKSNLERKLARLDDRLSANPVKHLVDEGIFQSIIEDVEDESADFSYKAKFTDKIGEFAEENIHPSLINVYKYGFITKDTPVYNAMFKFTQYSDFVARYTMYNHLTKVKGVDEQTALKQIIESFVNYDLPTHKWIQYGNDIGMIMFTKFLFRIQKVIFNQMADHPAEFFSLLTFQAALGLDAPDISDSLGPMPMYVGPFSVFDSSTTYAGLNIVGGIVDPIID